MKELLCVPCIICMAKILQDIPVGAILAPFRLVTGVSFADRKGFPCADTAYPLFTVRRCFCGYLPLLPKDVVFAAVCLHFGERRCTRCRKTHRIKQQGIFHNGTERQGTYEYKRKADITISVMSALFAHGGAIIDFPLLFGSGDMRAAPLKSMQRWTARRHTLRKVLSRRP